MSLRLGEQAGPHGKSWRNDAVTIVAGPDIKSTTNTRVSFSKEREKKGRGHVSEEILAPGADGQLPPQPRARRPAASPALPVPAQ